MVLVVLGPIDDGLIAEVTLVGLGEVLTPGL